VSLECITDLLQLVLNGNRLVENNEYRLLNELSSVRIGNRLLDRCETNKAISAGSTENHTFETVLFLGGNNSGDGRETHIKITSLIVGKKTIISIVTVPVGRNLRNSKTGCISHEESASLLQNFLQLNLLVVLDSELLGIAVEFLKLALISLEFDFDGFKELLLLGGGGEDKGFLVSSGS
jgi:hypothetical protein